MPTKNTLYYGDNLTVLREYIATESVDLIYLDPPFNSSRSYNVLFRDESGKESDAQITAFEDTWHWNAAAEGTYHALVTQADEPVSRMIEAMRQFIGANQMMAYLVMMAARLVELQRVLKPTGSIYLHCDPTASHYLKVVMDTIFGASNFRSDITWKRHSSHNDTRYSFASVTDTILHYARSKNSGLIKQFAPYSESYKEEYFNNVDSEGRRYAVNSLKSPSPRPNLTFHYKGFPPPSTGWMFSYEKMEELEKQGRLEFPKKPGGRIRLRYYLDEMLGAPISNLWDNIPALSGAHAERLGYPTQKPIALLERIVGASSNPGDIVLDPFCGCGTAVVAAQKMGRRWIGIDITNLSISLMKYRLTDSFGLVEGVDYEIKGEPVDYGSAAQLAADDKYQFQWWALSLINARPQGGSAGSRQGKKGADAGIDGVITFIDEAGGKAKRVIVQVKGGGVKVGDIRDLNGTLQREKAEIGVFITLESPTQPMRTEAVTAGYYNSPWTGENYPRIQILTIQDLLNGAKVKMPPPTTATTFKRAEASKGDAESQLRLDL